MITAIYIGTERLDLFEDENIVIKSNVSKISDITKVFTDTSNTFTVPATDVNNDIFKHWYNPNIVNGFDARKKVPAVIELGGLNFKVGQIQLNKVDTKQGIPYSYSLDYFGNLVALKDLVGNDKLTDLDMSSFNFNYTSTEVINRLKNIFNVSFSLLSKRRLLYDSTNTVEINDKQTNIYWDGTTSNINGVRITDLYGSVKQNAIISAIQTKYNLTFSTDFFNATDFNNQFLTLTGTDEYTSVQVPLTTSLETVDNTVNGNTMLAEGFGGSSERVTYSIQLFVYPVDPTITYSIYIKSNGIIVGQKDNLTGNSSIEVLQSEIETQFNNVTYWVASDLPINFNADSLRLRQSSSVNRSAFASGLVVNTPIFDVSKRMPDIKVIDYLKGLFQISKLIVIPQKDGTIYVDSLDQYYRKGKLYDLSDYIDVSAYEVSRGDIFSEINYKFQEPQTILAKEFKRQNNIAYGDLEYKINDEDFIEGGSIAFDLPFENMVYERIVDVNDSENVRQVQYGLVQDENLDFVTLKPHIHYIHNLPSSYKFINDGNLGERISFSNIPALTYPRFAYLYSLTFGNEFDTYDGRLVTNSLFFNYHKDYIERIFSEKKREYNFKAKDLPTSVVLQLQLNDVIQIKENYYRIESFDVNTSNNDVDFKLINDRNVNIVPQIPITGDNTFLTVDSTIVTSDQTIF